MLRRFSLGFASIAAAIVIVACSSAAPNPIGIGPTFPPSSLYASDSSQNAISIYSQATNGSGPVSNITSTGSLLGPQYLAFDSSGDLYASAYSQSSNASDIVEIKALATGNVTALATTNALSRPRGLGLFSVAGSTDPDLVVAELNASAPVGATSELALFDAVLLGDPLYVIGGSATGLNVPSGVATDTKTIYVTNLQGASVEGFAEPTSQPTLTPTPAATATPTATPSGSPTATPTPIATATPTINYVDQSPVFVIQGGATGLKTPVGIALDASSNIYVVDRGGSGTAPSVFVYAANPVGIVSSAPMRTITGTATLLNSPNDIKVDSTGRIYVSDSTLAGAGVIYIYAAGATGNVAPAATLTSPGSVVGIALTP